jgi:23S rRNA-/tRNA-specific pseudouridylate synthase
MMDGEFFEWHEATGALHRLWLLNRLDSATSGVILAATNADLATAIRAQFKRKQVRKIYHALVFGVPRAPLEIWRDLLTVEKRGGHIRTATAAGHVPAESRMSVVRVTHKAPRLALIKLEPRTGRSHQLRVQCAKRALPIVGDQTYGDFRANRDFAKVAETKRLFLHSLETSFDYEWGGRTFRFAAKAPLPDEFEKFL